MQEDRIPNGNQFKNKKGRTLKVSSGTNVRKLNFLVRKFLGELASYLGVKFANCNSPRKLENFGLNESWKTAQARRLRKLQAGKLRKLCRAGCVSSYRSKEINILYKVAWKTLAVFELGSC